MYDACSDCAKLGSDASTAQPKKSSSSRRSTRASNDDLFVRSDAGSVLRRKRESLGKSQEAFAQQLNVKESVVQAWESGTRQPTVSDAKRLERSLSISLLESGAGVSASEYKSSSASGGSLTIADMIKRKKR